jgi:hypothetical protein
MDCHAPFVFFGYELILPAELNLRRSISLLYDLNGMIESPFEIRSILPCFPPMVDDTVVTDGMVCIIIGFSPTSARETYLRSKELAAYVIHNPILDGFQVADTALFHCGIEWIPEVESDESDGSDESDESIEEKEEKEESKEEPSSPVYSRYFT